MKEVRISFETAKLAKECGFHIKNQHCYFSKHNVGTINDCCKWYEFNLDDAELNECSTLKDLYGESYAACTQFELQKWLREEHNIQTYAYSHTLKNGKWGDYVPVLNNKELADARDEEYQTYEEALEVALFKGLEAIQVQKI